MEKYNLILKITELYSRGENIIQYLRDLDNRSLNNVEDILISYDFQAGSYIKYATDNPTYIENYTSAIAKIIEKYLQKGSIIEIGVGEATCLGNVAKKLGKDYLFGGFDISWSRIFFARQYLSGLNVEASLFTADLFRMPFGDNSVDLVYTSHSIEPNGGREHDALKELYRIASKYLILLEPEYEFASDEGKARMERNGYVKNLKNVIDDLGFNLVDYRRFDYSANPLNPTALYVIEKSSTLPAKHKIELVCPLTHLPLEERTDHFFAPKALISYPKIMGIPCLLSDNGVLTTKMP